MCVRTIIDASAFRHLYEESKNTAGHQLRRWIANGYGLVVYSPDDTVYAEELNKNKKVLALLRDFSQRGQTEIIGAAQIKSAQNQIPGRTIRRSNDPHVLALATVGQATVLFSCDSKLQKDFADRTVLPKVGRRTRGSVPLKFQEPRDTIDAARRRQFFGRRRCATPCS